MSSCGPRAASTRSSASRSAPAPGGAGAGDAGADPGAARPRPRARSWPRCSRQLAEHAGRGQSSPTTSWASTSWPPSTCQQPPDLDEAQLAIDAMAALLDGWPAGWATPRHSPRRRPGPAPAAFVQLASSGARHRGRPARRARAPAASPAQARSGVAAASQRPEVPGARRRRSTAVADRDGAGAVGDGGAVEEVLAAVVGRAPCRSPRLVEGDDHAVPRTGPGHVSGRSWTIGSSMMSVAPASLSAGISDVDRRPWARPSRPRSPAVAEQLVTRSAPSSTAAARSPRRGRPSATLSFTSTLPRASSTPCSRVWSWCMAWRFVGVGVGRGLATSSV